MSKKIYTFNATIPCPEDWATNNNPYLRLHLLDDVDLDAEGPKEPFLPEGWVDLGVVQLAIDIDEKHIQQVAIEFFEQEIKCTRDQATQQIARYQQKLDSLKALPAPEDSTDGIS